MRISAERLGLAEQRTNPLGERELVLRGLAIPAIENLAATRDAFDTLDLTDNRITRLENFPGLQRLSHLMLSGNVIESFDVQNLSKNVPNLHYLELAHNHVASLREVANLGKACPKLETLCLLGNPVTRKFLHRYTKAPPCCYRVLIHDTVLFALQHQCSFCGVERDIPLQHLFLSV